MMDTHNHSEFRSLSRARQIAGGVMMLLALTLAGPARLWGQCSSQNPSYTGMSLSGVSPASVTGGDGTFLTVTIRLDGVAGPYPFMAEVNVWVTGVSAGNISPLYEGYVPIWTCTSSTTVRFTVASVSQPTTAIFHAGYGQGDLKAPFEVGWRRASAALRFEK